MLNLVVHTVTTTVQRLRRRDEFCLVGKDS